MSRLFEKEEVINEFLFKVEKMNKSTAKLIIINYLSPEYRDISSIHVQECLLHWLKFSNFLTSLDHENEFIRFTFQEEETLDLFDLPRLSIIVHFMKIEEMNYIDQKRNVETIKSSGKHPLEICILKIQKGFWLDYDDSGTISSLELDAISS